MNGLGGRGLSDFLDIRGVNRKGKARIVLSMTGNALSLNRHNFTASVVFSRILNPELWFPWSLSWLRCLVFDYVNGWGGERLKLIFRFSGPLDCRPPDPKTSLTVQLNSQTDDFRPDSAALLVGSRLERDSQLEDTGTDRLGLLEGHFRFS